MSHFRRCKLHWRPRRSQSARGRAWWRPTRRCWWCAPCGSSHAACSGGWWGWHGLPAGGAQAVAPSHEPYRPCGNSCNSIHAAGLCCRTGLPLSDWALSFAFMAITGPLNRPLFTSSQRNTCELRHSNSLASTPLAGARAGLVPHDGGRPRCGGQGRAGALATGLLVVPVAAVRVHGRGGVVHVGRLAAARLGTCHLRCFCCDRLNSHKQSTTKGRHMLCIEVVTILGGTVSLARS